MERDLEHLHETVRIARQSRDEGNHPFGALLVGPGGEVLLRGGNTFATDRGTGHAESNVARQASRLYAPEFLQGCTLYSAVEPCCMCSGACYWAGIGTVVFGMSEKRLAEIVGHSPKNLTLDIPCQTVFAAGHRPVVTRGPFREIEDEVAEGHRGFWT
jgi:tRNA(Arg) A34 adenosine deaminase TadA